MMDGSLLLESLDSLWFFTNVLSSTNGTKEFEPPDPISPIAHQNQQNYDPSKAEFVKPRCDEFAADEIEQEIVQPSVKIEDHQVSNPVKKEERQKRRKSRKRRISKRKMTGELNYLGLHGNCHYKDYGFFGVFGNEKTWGEYGMFASQPQHHHRHHHHHQVIKMPPLNDGVAMKEHLKSWAYAVACRVR